MKELIENIDTSKSAEHMIQDMLADYRKARGFDVTKYIKLKGRAINKFFRDNKLDAAVVGISGGVDSAVVYKLQILEYNYWEHFNAAKSIALILPIEDPKRKRIEAEMNRLAEEINILKNGK